LEGDLDLDELPKDELNIILKNINSKDKRSIYESSLGEFLSKDEIDLLLADHDGTLNTEHCRVVAIFKLEEGSDTANSKGPKDS